MEMSKRRPNGEHLSKSRCSSGGLHPLLTLKSLPIRCHPSLNPELFLIAMTPSPIDPSKEASISETPTPLTVNFWEQRYQADTTRWDLGKPAPALADWLDQPQAPNHGRVIVLGCGRGHDARLFAHKGFEVTAIDYAPSAIAEAQAAAEAEGLSIRFLQRDIFALTPDYANYFDYVVEHTCFCALAPHLRDRYVDLTHTLLKPGGLLLGIFFTHNRPGGPPYGTTPDALRQQFGRCFDIHTLAPTSQSVESRRGEEHLGEFYARAA